MPGRNTVTEFVAAFYIEEPTMVGSGDNQSVPEAASPTFPKASFAICSASLGCIHLFSSSALTSGSFAIPPS